MSVSMENLVDFETLTWEWESIPDPCEHSEHLELTDFHEGDGKYLVKITCPNLDLEGSNTYYRLFCEKFVSCWEGSMIRCTLCKNRHHPEETYEIIGVKGVDL